MSKVVDTTLYDILKVSPTSSVDEIKKSFRKLALKWHPDKWSNASEQEKKTSEDKFKELSDAYTILTDSEKRKLYNKVGLNGMKNGGQREMTEEEMREMFEGMGANFSQFGMGGMGRQRKSIEPTMPKLVHTLKVSLKDIYLGSTIEFEVERYVLKNGKQPQIEDFECKGCKGRGSTIHIRSVGPGMMTQSEQACMKCHGKGSSIPDNFF